MLEKIIAKLKELIVKKSFWTMLTTTVASVIALIAAYHKTATIEQLAAAWVIVKSILDYFVSKFSVDDTIRTINRKLESVNQVLVFYERANTYRVIRTEPEQPKNMPTFFQG